MCLAIPGKVIGIKQDKAVIDYGEEKREALNLIGAKVGDFVIVSLGKVAVKISEEEAMASLEQADITKAVVELKNLELAYETTIATAARIIQPSLMDFLR